MEPQAIAHSSEGQARQFGSINRPQRSGLPEGPATDWIPIRALRPADSPRQETENVEHTRMLASLGVRLPPIWVQRATMRVIDGTHRLGAALLRGDDMIEVCFFDGSDQEAFVLAVKANTAHGLPLSLAERMQASERIIVSHPTWSDRAIAAVTGLGARTVGDVRRRMHGRQGGTRIGRDGRVRPVDGATGRLRAYEALQRQPDASLREIAKEAGVSPTTALDVRNRIRRGEDPLPSRQLTGEDAVPARAVPQDTRASGADVTTMLNGLKQDPSLRFTESGRVVLRWVASRVVEPRECLDVVEKVPPHCTYVMAEVARRCADEWAKLATALEERARQA